MGPSLLLGLPNMQALIFIGVAFSGLGMCLVMVPIVPEMILTLNKLNRFD